MLEQLPGESVKRENVTPELSSKVSDYERLHEQFQHKRVEMEAAIERINENIGKDKPEGILVGAEADFRRTLTELTALSAKMGEMYIQMPAHIKETYFKARTT